MSGAAGKEFLADGQYALRLYQHTLPPTPQWTVGEIEGTEQTNWTFDGADYNSVLISPANFTYHQSPIAPYPGLTTSPVDETLEIIDWVDAQEPGTTIFIYGKLAGDGAIPAV